MDVHGGRTDSAVLVPLFVDDGLHAVFTKRRHDLRRHAGEISFPGGLVDEGESPADAARREAFEEIGLEPTLPRLVGSLPPVHTHVSAILVVPFVGLLEVEPSLVPSEAEIEAILSVPVARLAAAEETMELPRPDGTGTWRGWAYPVDGHTIWGATGMMLHAFLEVLREGAPWALA
jgi:8-oxo-dGTP pyrophosphatase MutT (NUDIX family)